MLIVQTGMYRSGTTWQFNALRLMLEQAFPGEVYSCFWQHYKREERKKINLIKVHKWRRQMARDAHHIFTTYRDPEEVRESMERHSKLITDPRFSNGSNVERFGEFWGQYESWRNVPKTQVVDFNMIYQNPGAIIDQMAKILKINIDTERVLSDLNDLKPPKEGYDPITLLHANHITKR